MYALRYAFKCVDNKKSFVVGVSHTALSFVWFIILRYSNKCKFFVFGFDHDIEVVSVVAQRGCESCQNALVV